MIEHIPRPYQVSPDIGDRRVLDLLDSAGGLAQHLRLLCIQFGIVKGALGCRQRDRRLLTDGMIGVVHNVRIL